MFNCSTNCLEFPIHMASNGSTFPLNEKLLEGSLGDLSVGETTGFLRGHLRTVPSRKVYKPLHCYINIIGDELLLNFGAKFQR